VTKPVSATYFRIVSLHLLDDERALAEGLMVPVQEAIAAQDIYGRNDPELGLVGVEQSVENAAALNSFVNSARGEMEKGNGDDHLRTAPTHGQTALRRLAQAHPDGWDFTRGWTVVNAARNEVPQRKTVHCGTSCLCSENGLP